MLVGFVGAGAGDVGVFQGSCEIAVAEGVSELEEVDAGFEAVGGVGVTEDFGADAAAEVGYAGVVGDDVLQE